MTVLVPGWSRAGPWLNLSKNFEGFQLFSKSVGPSQITQRNKTRRVKAYDKNISVEPVFA